MIKFVKELHRFFLCADRYRVRGRGDAVAHCTGASQDFSGIKSVIEFVKEFDFFFPFSCTSGMIEPTYYTCMCVYVYLYLCMCICIYVNVYVYTYTYTHK